MTTKSGRTRKSNSNKAYGAGNGLVPKIRLHPVSTNPNPYIREFELMMWYADESQKVSSAPQDSIALLWESDHRTIDFP